jgi:hypothetical protein
VLATPSTGYRWAWRRPDVVHVVVSYITWNSTGMGELRVLCEEVFHGCSASAFHAGDRLVCGLGPCRPRCDSVEESVVPAVDEETGVGKSTPMMGGLDVGHHEEQVKSRRNPSLRLREIHQ